MDVKEFVSDASTVILVLAIVSNTVFIFAIRNGTRSTITHAYQTIMTCFAVFNIMFASTEFIIQPGIHIYGTSLMTFSHSSFQQVKPWGHILLSAFIGMYGMNTALLTLHFVYRYIAVCRQKFSRLFEETTSVTVITGSLFLWGSFYFFVTFYCFAATEDYYRYAGLSVDATFGTDIRELSFFCIFTHETGTDATNIYWLPTIGIFLTLLMMVTTFTIMLICAINMYRTLKKSSMSAKSRTLQTQLLKALTVQAVIPLFTSYVSRVVLYFSSIMGYPPLKIYSFTPLVVTIYTVLDPIAIMFFICDYRKVINSFKRSTLSSIYTGMNLLGKVTPIKSTSHRVESSMG